MATRAPGNHGKRKGRPDSPARTLRILVVENHADTRRGIQAFLKALGHRADFAEDLNAALARARRATFDVLLSDISLPDGTGWELLQTLDQIGLRPPHAIAMSGLGDSADQTRSLEAGYELHLVKPFRPQDLGDALRRLALSPASPALAPRTTSRAELRKRLHDGLAQHLAAAALLQGALANALETLTTGDAPARLKEAAAESRQIAILLDKALTETLSLLRSV